MRILQTPPRFYPFVGGVEESSLGLSRELVRLGHSVKVICAQEGAGVGAKTIDGIEVVRLPYPFKVANTNVTVSLPLWLLREEYDLVHTYLPTPWSADWSGVIAGLKRKPLVLTYHNDIVGSGANRLIAGLYNKTLLRFTLNRARRIIVTSGRYAELSPHLASYRDKICVIPVGVDTDRFRPLPISREANTLSFLSILDEYHRYKGLDHLMEAIALTRRRIPDVKLVVGGKGRLVDYYRGLASDLGISDAVRFEGFVPEEALVKFYNQYSVFVLPSTTSEQEGFGIALLEAMSCGVPVIATTAVGMVQEIQDSKAGLIASPGDTKALAEAITSLLHERQLREEMGRNGRKLVKDRFDWRAVAHRVIEIYESCLG